MAAEPYSDIWFLLQRPDKYAYHYTRAATLPKILRNARLRFSSFSRLNDPRESKDWVLGFHSFGADLELASRTALHQELNRHLKHAWRVGCFASDVYEACSTREREEKGEDIVAALYDRGYARPRMWAQYAQEYRGACLVFDRAKLDQAVREAARARGRQVFHAAVSYRNPNPLVSLGRTHHLLLSLEDLINNGVRRSCEEHVAQHWRQLFMLKARDWEHERELRWIVSADDESDFFVDIADCCVGVILGDRAPMSARRVVSSFARIHNKSLAVMAWTNGFPQPVPEHWRLLQDREHAIG